MRKILLILLCCVLLTGCLRVEAEPSAPVESTESAAVERRSKPGLTPGLAIKPYEINGYGFDGDLHLDGDGMYYSYEGGEMCVTAFHKARGLSQKGIALFLYVDGRAQPFHTAERTGDAYMHMIYPENNQDTFTGLYFTPLVGEEGDTLEICLLSIVAPYDYTDFIEEVHVPAEVRPRSNAMQTDSSIVRMKYRATPPACILPSVPERLVSWVSYTEARGSQQEYEREAGCNLLVQRYYSNGEARPLHGYRGESPRVRLFLRLWGDPVAEFGLILYVNHRPVSIDPDNILLVQPSEGENLVLEIELDLSDFYGDALLYAVLVPRNYRSAELGSSCEPRIFGAFCLFRNNNATYIVDYPTTP